MSDASITPLEYLIPRMDVPVTIGRRVRSLAEDRADADEEEVARGAPPEERLSDMMAVIRSRKREGLNDGIFEKSNSLWEENECGYCMELLIWGSRCRCPFSYYDSIYST